MRFKYLVCLFIIRSLLTAESSTWTGDSGDGSWQTTGNWTNGVPGITGIVHLAIEAIFPSGSDITVSLADTVILNKLRVDQDITLSGKSLIFREERRIPAEILANGRNLIFNNPLIIDGNANIANYGSQPSDFKINNGLKCVNANISFYETDIMGEISSTLRLTNSKAIFLNSALDVFSDFFMDSSSSILLEDSSFTYVGNDSLQPGNITFLLTKNFASEIYFSSSGGDIDLAKSMNTIALAENLQAGTNTFILYQTVAGLSEIRNFNTNSFKLPQNSSSIIWYGPAIFENVNISVTADVQHSVSSSIRSVMSTTSQVTLSTARQLENSRQNARISDQTYLSANSSEHDDSHLAQNTILSQSTPVEQLWERGVYHPCHNWSVYVAPLGSFGSTKTKNLQPGSDFYNAGFFAGFDWMNSYHPQSNIGFGLGSTFYYSRLHADAERHLGKVDVDHIFANIYGTAFFRRLEELSFNFGFGAGYNWYDMERVTGHLGSLVAYSETKGHEIGSFAGIEYLFSSIRHPCLGNFRFMPMFYLQYNRLEIDDYSEHGAGEFDVRVRTDHLNSLRSFLGARTNYLFSVSQNVTVRPEITMGWQREYFSDSICTSFNTIELATPQGVCSTIAPERNTLIVGADMYMKMFQWTSLELNYQFTYNNILKNHEFYLQWKVDF